MMYLNNITAGIDKKMFNKYNLKKGDKMFGCGVARIVLVLKIQLILSSQMKLIKTIED